MELVIMTLIAIMALAKNTNKAKNDIFDLGFLPQTTLSGMNAVEMLKAGVEISSLFKIVTGTIGKLSEVYNLPIDSFHLDIEASAYLLFGFGMDRPVLCYQNSAMSIIFEKIGNWNVEGMISEVENMENGLVRILAKEIDGQYQWGSLNWDREKGKFGKYTLI